MAGVRGLFREEVQIPAGHQSGPGHGEVGGFQGRPRRRAWSRRRVGGHAGRSREEVMPARVMVLRMWDPKPEGAVIVSTVSKSATAWERQLSPFTLGPCKLYDKFTSKN